MYLREGGQAVRAGQGGALLAGFVITFHHLHLPTRPLNGSYPLVKVFHFDMEFILVFLSLLGL